MDRHSFSRGPGAKEEVLPQQSVIPSKDQESRFDDPLLQMEKSGLSGRISLNVLFSASL